MDFLYREVFTRTGIDHFTQSSVTLSKQKPVAWTGFYVGAGSRISLAMLAPPFAPERKCYALSFVSLTTPNSPTFVLRQKFRKVRTDFQNTKRK